jgi:hypothetical protein
MCGRFASILETVTHNHAIFPCPSEQEKAISTKKQEKAMTRNA